jgi:hypothetical protein
MVAVKSDAGASTPHQASQRVEKEIQLDSASIQILNTLESVASSFE